MIALDDKKILIGGFHEHWHRIDTVNPAYLLSALNYYNYDFISLMDGIDCSTRFQSEAARFTDKIKLFPGREYGCPWGHVVAVGLKNNCEEDDLYHEIAEIVEPKKVFERLRQAYDLVVLAHPDYEITWNELFLTGEVDRMIDDNVIDAVNIINTSGFSKPRHRILIEWYEKREAEGRRTPIVGGWDAHLMMNRINDPEILYTRHNTPEGHIDTAGGNRSVVIGAQNDLSSIIKAVKECRIVIEDIKSKEFVGPARWIDFLNENNYHRTIAEIANERDAIVVSKNHKWYLGEPAEITFNQSGTVLYPVGDDATEESAVIANKPAHLTNVSMDLVRDEVGIPVAFTNEEGFKAIYCVRASHQIRIDVLPKHVSGKQYLEVRFLVPFEGDISIESALSSQPLRMVVSKEQSEVLIEVNCQVTAPVKYILRATTRNGVTRVFEGVVNFYPVRRFAGSWDDVPLIEIDKDEFFPSEFGYAATEPWLGPDLFSGAVRMSWTRDALHFRVDITDPIHDQPLFGHFTYDADCVQIAIDPLHLRREYRGHFYNYNLALTESGPELYQMFTPDLDVNDNPVSIPEDISLGDKYLSIEKTSDGLIYNLALPWELLGRAAPRQGERMGIYFILLNSNGNGVINNLKWPVPIEGMWMIPKRWATIEFV